MKIYTQCTAFLMSLCLLISVTASAKPMKVYILVGQSNMEGHAHVNTIASVGKNPNSKSLYKDMVDSKGEPIVLNDVIISYHSGSGNKKVGFTPTHRAGKLTSGFGGARKGPKIGPEFTFGIYMHKHTKEPFLIIKSAWGGTSLHTEFRPPSVDPKNQAGSLYKQMIKNVKSTLGDIKSIHPAYKEKNGYEIAGFVWFQGFNDMIDGKVYPNRKKAGGFTKYTNDLRSFIKDVRKDLTAPNMKFVIGVMGIDGIDATSSKAPGGKKAVPYYFQRAMAETANTSDFKGNVEAVHTSEFWDKKLAEADYKKQRITKSYKSALKKKKLNKVESRALFAKMLKERLTDEDRETLKGVSNQAYHYLGSAEIIGRIGKAFAETMVKLER